MQSEIFSGVHTEYLKPPSRFLFMPVIPHVMHKKTTPLGVLFDWFSRDTRVCQSSWRLQDVVNLSLLSHSNLQSCNLHLHHIMHMQ